MTRSKRILVYGFGPYRQYRENITAKIIESLPPAPRLKGVVFPVRFHRGQFVQALERHKPDVVLGLGQSSRRTLEIETRAANRRRAEKRAPARAIRKHGPRWLLTTLDVETSGSVKRSNNAGDYVCNYSMYIMLDRIRRSRHRTAFGFVHIPYDCRLHVAAKFVMRSLQYLQKSRRNFGLCGDEPALFLQE